MLSRHIANSLCREEGFLGDQGHTLILPVQKIGTAGISPVAYFLSPLVDHMVFPALIYQSVDVVHPFRTGTEMILSAEILPVVDALIVRVILSK